MVSLLPLATTIMVLPMVFGLSFYLGFPFSAVTQVLPIVIIAISVADSVHILSYYYQCLGRGLTRREALASSLRKNFLPSFLTTVSTFIGFFSFSLSEIGPVRVFGILGGLSCFFCLVFDHFYDVSDTTLDKKQTSTSASTGEQFIRDVHILDKKISKCYRIFLSLVGTFGDSV